MYTDVVVHAVKCETCRVRWDAKIKNRQVLSASESRYKNAARLRTPSTSKLNNLGPRRFIGVVEEDRRVQSAEFSVEA